MVQVGEQVEKYTVEALIGEGGMATVWRVRHNHLGTAHALKLLTGSFPASVAERLRYEGQVQARLRHPNIVSVTDIVVVGDRAGLVMELVEGPSLAALAKRHRFDLQQIDRLARRILAAMGHAHARGYIHRDLKPANVLLEVAPSELVPKIADFGLAKALETSGDDSQSRTRSGVAMGTPPYMAPEQIRSARDIDTRADVYSLGVLLYQLIGRRRPYSGEDLIELYEQASRRSCPPLSELVQGLPGRMEDAVFRALSPARDDRPADALALLELWAGGEPEAALSDAELWGTLPATALAIAAEDKANISTETGAADATYDGSHAGDAPPEATGGGTLRSSPQVPFKPPADPKPRLPLIGFALLLAGGVVLATGGLVGIGVVVLLLLRPAPPAVPVPEVTPVVPDPPVVAVPEVAPVVPDPPAPRAVTLVSDPSGARVLAGDTELGRTPLTVEVAVGEAPRWTLRLDGFEEAVVVPPDGTGDAEVRTALRRRPRRASPPKPAPTEDIKRER